MGRLALPHRGRAVVLPALALLEPYIDRTGSHWYWLLEFFDDGLDRSAEFPWSPPDENRTNFMVPRLLWQLANPLHQGRLLLENTCGLFTCINPGHWRKRPVAAKIPARFVLPDNVEAVPVTHVNAMITVHVRRSDAQSTLCGVGGRGCVALDKKAPVTCDECISTWVRSGQPYTEVK